MSKMWERADFWPLESGSAPTIDEFARGLAEGRRTVEAEVESERASLLQLVTSLEALQAPESGLIATLIVASVERLVTEIAGQVPVDAALLRARAEALAAAVASEGDVLLAAHPDDVALLDGELPVVGDPALVRGTVQARTRSDVFEDGIMPALDRLRGEFLRLGFAT